MWKLDKKDFRKFHKVYFYLILLFVLSIFMHLIANASINNLTFRGGYTMVYSILAYPIILILYYLINLTHVFVSYIMILFVLAYFFVKTVYGSSFDGENISNTTVYFSIMLFIGYVVYNGE